MEIPKAIGKIKRLNNNLHIPDLVEAFSHVEKLEN